MTHTQLYFNLLALEPFEAKGLRRTLLQNRNLTSVFRDRTSFRAKRVALGHVQMQIAILPQFLAIEPHFVRKGCARDDPGRFCKSQSYLSFWRSNLIACAMVCRTRCRAQFFLRFSAIEPHFVRKGFATGPFARNRISYLSFWRSNLISCERVCRTRCRLQSYLCFRRSNLVSCERVAFRAVQIVGTAPRLQERNKKRRREQEVAREQVLAREQEGKRARGQESKRAREQEGKRARGQESKRARENVKM